MTKIFGLLTLLVCTSLYAQNTGVGTTTPQTKLHVVDSSGDATVTVQTPVMTSASQVRLKTNGSTNDYLQLQKWGPGASGAVAGISLTNLSTLFAGANAGPLAMGTQANNHLHLITGNAERIRITSEGLVGVNHTSPIAYLDVRSSNNTTAIFGYNNNLTGINWGISGALNSSKGAAVVGVSYNGFGASGVEDSHFGVAGSVGNDGIGVGAYALAGTALRGKSTSGLALHTSGSVRLTGISEGEGKVLTSDASGNATWQTIAASWTLSGNNMYNSNTGNVGIGTTSPAQKLDVAGVVRATAFQYSSPRTSYYSLSGADFVAKQGSDVERREEIAGGGVAVVSSTEGLVAPVHLPHGATITRVTVYFTDVSSAVNLEFVLRVNTGFPILMSLSSTGTPGNTSLTTTSISSATIDNSNNAYVFHAVPTGGSWPAFDLIVRRVIIEYTMSGL